MVQKQEQPKDNWHVRQVQTMRERYPNFYQEQGRKKHKRGFDNPEVAKAAAKKMQEVRRIKKILKQKLNEPVTIHQESESSPSDLPQS